MPTIAIVDGILILLYFNDHVPAHFRAQGADFHARIRIEDGEVVESDGRIPLAIVAGCVNGHWPIATS
jgi:hypothetical protein